MNKITDNSPVTNKTLDKKFKESEKRLTRKFATKDDLKNELKKYATKDYLGDIADTILKGVGSMFDQMNDKFLTSQDKIMKRLDDLDANNAAGSIQNERLTIRVDNHDERLRTLESKN